MPDSNTLSTHTTGTPAADTKTQFSVTGINIAAEQQPQPTAQFRLVMISFLAAGIGLLAVVTYHRFPSFDQAARLRELGVRALIDKRAHSDLIEIVDHLLTPRWAAQRCALESIT